MCHPNAIVSVGVGGPADALRLRAHWFEIVDGAAGLSGQTQPLARTGLPLDAGSTVGTALLALDARHDPRAPAARRCSSRD